MIVLIIDAESVSDIKEFATPTRLLSFDFVFLLAPRQYSSKLDIALVLASVV